MYDIEQHEHKKSTYCPRTPGSAGGHKVDDVVGRDRSRGVAHLVVSTLVVTSWRYDSAYRIVVAVVSVGAL